VSNFETLDFLLRIIVSASWPESRDTAYATAMLLGKSLRD